MGAGIVRLACPEDDAGIADLMSRVVMPGSVGMSYHMPSFFAAIEPEGYDPKVFVGEKAGRIVGVGSLTKRKVRLDGKPTEIGYLSSLRLEPESRGSFFLARGFRMFCELMKSEAEIPFFLTSLMRSNIHAKKILTSGKAGLPQYRFLAGYVTALMPVLRSYPPHKRFVIAHGDETGADPVFECFEQYGGKKDFFTVYDRKDWLNSSGMLKGLRPKDFIVAFEGSKPVGVAALWDQSSFRQLIVRSYSGKMRIASLADTIIGKLTKETWLPIIDKPFASVYLSCVAVRNNDPEVFRAILTAAFNRMRERKKKLLTVGFFENDILSEVVSSYVHLPFHSDIHMVTRDGKTVSETRSERYLDAGSL